jgi:hypothetical protein
MRLVGSERRRQDEEDRTKKRQSGRQKVKTKNTQHPQGAYYSISPNTIKANTNCCLHKQVVDVLRVVVCALGIFGGRDASNAGKLVYTAHTS